MAQMGQGGVMLVEGLNHTSNPPTARLFVAQMDNPPYIRALIPWFIVGIHRSSIGYPNDYPQMILPSSYIIVSGWAEPTNPTNQPTDIAQSWSKLHRTLWEGGRTPEPRVYTTRVEGDRRDT